MPIQIIVIHLYRQINPELSVTVIDYHKCILNTPLSGTAFFYALMPRKLYLDESGDLGWKFTSAYRNGGSSRFLTIAYLIIPEGEYHICNRLVKDVYKKLKVNPATELKATTISLPNKIWVAEQIVACLNANPKFMLGAITVKKERVAKHIQADGNKLYNYMMAISILDKVKTFPRVHLIRDERSMKVASGNSCVDYMQTKMWFDYNSPTVLVDAPTASHKNLNLIFIDWVANFVWSHYEDGKSDPYLKLSAKIINQTLFF